MKESKALIIIDVQKDFCPNGSRGVPSGDEVIGPLNRMLDHVRNKGWLIVASRDWHTRDQFDDPARVHCIQETDGAKFHDGLKLPDDLTIISKGAIDGSPRHHSAFNGDNLSLDEHLKNSGIREIYLGGLAYNICVRATVLDALSKGYVTYVLDDASRTSDPESLSNLRSELEKSGAIVTTVTDVISGSSN